MIQQKNSSGRIPPLAFAMCRAKGAGECFLRYNATYGFKIYPKPRFLYLLPHFLYLFIPFYTLLYL